MTLADLPRLRAEHAALLALIADAARVAAAVQPAPAAALAALTALRVALAAHQAGEDPHLYPRLAGGTGLADQAAALLLIAELRRLLHDWHFYLIRWTPARMARDWPGFAAETQPLLARLRARLEREEGLLAGVAVRAA